MKSLTKLLIALFGLLSILGLGLVLATSTSSNNWYNAPITDNNLNFKASLDNGKVYTSWNVFSKEPLKWYKVMRSTTNSNPVYPEDSYIAAISNMNTTSHVDSSPKTAYYRVCAITTYNNRYCSNVIKISYEAAADKYEWYAKSSWYTTIPDNNMNFSAKIYNEKVYTSWNKYGHSETFKYYKVVRSTTNSNPVYPDDGYIKAIGNISDITYLDASPKVWYAYYRVCAITEWNLRYCSNVVKLYVSGTTNDENTGDSDDTSNYSYDNAIQLTQEIKDKLDSIIETFIGKLESKYEENSDRANYIDKVIDNLEALNSKKPRLKNVVNYLVDLLEAKRDVYDNGLDEIEDIFDV